jgi:Ca2+-binding RTX toxin-like protein
MGMKIVNSYINYTNGGGYTLDATNPALYVGKQGFIGSEQGDAVLGRVGSFTARIEGSIVGLASIIRFESLDPSHRQEIVFAKGSSGYGFADGVQVIGLGTVIRNAGAIEAHNNSAIAIVDASGIVTTTVSTVTNTGTIIGGSVGAGVYFEGAEAGKLFNSGTIEGGAGSFYALRSSGQMTVINSGTMIDDILFGSGNDTYDGTSGRIVDGKVFGGSGDDSLRGGTFAETFSGEDGIDSISAGGGNDILNGGLGADKLNGGLGADRLTGESGQDQFIYSTIADSTVATSGLDTILDFKRTDGDRINLSPIDANTALSGNQAFKLIGTDAFHKTAGELRYEIKGGDTFVYGDVNGDAKADFSINLDRALAMQAADFVL